MRIAHRSIVSMAAAAALVLAGGPASATATTPIVFHETFVEEHVDPGCHEQVTVRIEGDRTVHEVDVNGGIRVSVIELGTASFTEAGEVFAGDFTRTFAINLPAASIPVGDAVVVTQQFSATMHGDAGDTAVLHVTAHATVFADGDVAVAFVIVHHSCSG